MKRPAEIRSMNIAVGLMWFLGIFGVVGIIILIVFLKTQEPITLGVGLLFCLSWFVVIPLAKHNLMQTSVQKNGIRLLTQFVAVIDAEGKDIHDNKTVSRGPFFIKTSWYDKEQNVLYYFQSHSLFQNPQKNLQNITGIYVYVDPNNFHKNSMDLSFLPPHFLKE